MPNNEPILEDEFFGGVIGANPKAHKDYTLMAMSLDNAEDLEPLDWDTGFMVDDAPDENQGTSGSCTEQAFCYDFFHKHGIQLSRNDGYSRIGRPDQSGAYPHEPYYMFDKEGQHTRINSPDPSPQTEENMKKPVDIDKPRFDDLKCTFWTPSDYHIDTIARMIKTFNGMTGSFAITKEGWKDKKFPRAPSPNEPVTGGHMVWLCGFKRINGEKKIIAKSSWRSVKHHHFGEDYYFIGTPHAYGHYRGQYRKVLDNMEYVIIEYKGKLGVALFDGGFVEAIMWAKDKQQILDLIKAYSITVAGYDSNGYPIATHKIEKK